MQYTDRVYGTVEIDEPVILKLIETPTLQRLMDVDNAGYFEPFYPGTSYSRFEHSVGVYLLLKKFGAPLEEQIAGLIHDVSHTAFSHCVDYALDEGSEKEQNFQDNIFEDFVKRSEIPSVLQSFHVDITYLLDDANFPLKEKDLPDLCADRIDYALRTAIHFKEIADASDILNHLTTENSQWIFNDFASAKRFAELFLKLNMLYFSGLPSAVMQRATGDYLRHALSKGYITKHDLYTTDKQVLQKTTLHHSNDAMFAQLFDRMNNRVPFRNDPSNYDCTVFCKSRVVDPLCKHMGRVERISEIDPTWRITCERESKPKEYFLKFE